MIYIMIACLILVIIIIIVTGYHAFRKNGVDNLKPPFITILANFLLALGISAFFPTYLNRFLLIPNLISNPAKSHTYCTEENGKFTIQSEFQLFNDGIIDAQGAKIYVISDDLIKDFKIPQEKIKVIEKDQKFAALEIISLKPRSDCLVNVFTESYVKQEDGGLSRIRIVIVNR